MTRLALFLVMIMSVIVTSAQKTTKKLDAPKESSTVKREYDDKGNLIRFDST